MTNFLQWFTNWFIGSPGRFILEITQNNTLIFLVLVTLYGILLLYARMMLISYMPKKLFQFIKQRIIKLDLSQRESVLQDYLIEEWENELKQLPWYVVVPSKNELWVKRPTKHYRMTKQLAYRNSKQNENYDSMVIKDLISQYQTLT